MFDLIEKDKQLKTEEKSDTTNKWNLDLNSNKNVMNQNLEGVLNFYLT